MDSPEIRSISVSALTVDRAVAIQRSVIDHRRVNKIVNEYNVAALGILTVSERPDGTFHIIDGMHRHAASQIVGVEKLQCRVFTGLSRQEEAKMFRLLNNTAKPTAIDLFKVRVIEGDPIAVDVNRIVIEHGWTVELSNSRAAFAATSAAERIYRLNGGPVALERAITTVTRAWGHGREAVDNRVIEGIGLVFARYGTTVDAEELTDKLARYPGGAGGLIGKARGLRDFINGAISRAMAEVVVELYNKGRRTRALPPWRAS